MKLIKLQNKINIRPLHPSISSRGMPVIYSQKLLNLSNIHRDNDYDPVTSVINLAHLKTYAMITESLNGLEFRKSQPKKDTWTWK